MQNRCIATPLVYPLEENDLQIGRHIQGHNTPTHIMSLPLSKYQIKIRTDIGYRVLGTNVDTNRSTTILGIGRSLGTKNVSNIVTRRTGVGYSRGREIVTNTFAGKTSIHTTRDNQCRTLRVDRCYGHYFGCRGGRVYNCRSGARRG